MKNYVAEIIGKTISSVIIRERNTDNPRAQLLIVISGLFSSQNHRNISHHFHRPKNQQMTL